MKARWNVAAVLCAVGLVWASVPAAQATFPGANGRIAWSRDGDIFTARPDGSGKRQLTNTPRFERAEWSPEGGALAIVREPATLEQRPRILLRQGSETTGLGRARFSVQGLTWSPDGRYLAYCDMDFNNDLLPWPYPSAIKVIDVASGTQTRLTEFSEKACEPSWSPDSTQIAFRDGHDTPDGPYPSDTDIFVMNADGSNIRPITDDDSARQFNPKWSPDGASLSFERPVPGSDGGDISTMIQAVSIDGTNVRTLTAPDAAYDGSHQWSPDGSRILFYRMQATGDYQTHLGLVNSDGTGEQLLTVIEPGWPVWSPDSTKIAFNHRGNIFVIGVDGWGLTKVVGGQAIDVFPSWKSR